MTDLVKHWRRAETEEGGWYWVYWFRADAVGIRNNYISVFGKELADTIVAMLNAKGSSCATGVDGFNIVCARGGIGCPLEHTVL